MSRTLHAITFSPARIPQALDALAEAIGGQATYLPLPAHDPERAHLLSTALRAGQDIDDSVAVVVATSGSTGTPKGALLTPENLVSSADATHQALGGAGGWVLALPPHHIAGVQVLVRSLVAGHSPEVVSVERGFDVGAFAAASHAARARHERLYTSLVPLQLMKAMDTLQGIDALRVYDRILIGGAALREDVAAAAARLNIHITATYGSSETSGGCVYDGRPIPGARLRVRGGRVFLGGPMIAAGYRNPVADNPFAEPGWFATSDAGSISEGRLHIIGRMDTIIDTGGLKLHPEVLEKALTALEGVDAACVTGVEHPRLGQAVVAAYTGTATPATVMEGLQDLPRWQVPKDLRRVAQLPVTGPGKVDRAAVRELFAGLFM